MTRDEIFTSIVTIIRQQLHQKDIVITESTRLQEDLGIDSIALMELIIKLEDTFQLTIPDEAVDQMTSMGELLDYIANQLHKTTKA
ncbi:acyl carrier protein [Streptococcus sp. zg-JUN1979]|uniref:acyl carrier protein n=1 Tax=Streptococcus sp. zg-JUN1979 TaxID=3391450 RepID=UPI0039A50647